MLKGASKSRKFNDIINWNSTNSLRSLCENVDIVVKTALAMMSINQKIKKKRLK